MTQIELSRETGSATKGALGSLSWARATRGHLSSGERLTLALQGMRAMIVERPRLWFYRHGLLEGGTLALLDEVPRPDSPAAEQALREMERCSPGFLSGHCHRSYILGWLLGRVRGLTCDAEALYVAAMLHDLPLTAEYAFPAGVSDCFALDGATVANEFLRARGWDPGRTRTVEEAICMHVNIQVRTVHGVEAHLLNAGTACDLTGVGLTELARRDLERLVANHPRVGLAEGFAALIAEQARRRPMSRAALLHRFGLRAVIQRAPFPAGSGDERPPHVSGPRVNAGGRS